MYTATNAMEDSYIATCAARRASAAVMGLAMTGEGGYMTGYL